MTPLADALQSSLALTRITASKLDLAVECAHWATLDLPPDEPGPAALEGTAFHALVEGRKPDGRPAILAAARRRHTAWVAAGGPALLPELRRHEVAYCLHPDGTVSELGEGMERDYSNATGICGTLDVVSVGRVVDLKTGRPRVAAPDSWQLRFGAVVTGAKDAEFHYVALDGAVTIDSARFNKAQRESDKRRLIQLIEEVRQGPEAKPGEHCDLFYCPARGMCEAYKIRKEGRPMGRMALSNVITGTEKKPLRAVVYGAEFSGKTTLGASMPKVVFICAERGLGMLDVPRFPTPQRWEDIHEAIEQLTNEPHDYKSLCLDTVDWTAHMLEDYMCRKHSKTPGELGSYGLGIKLSLPHWRALLDALEKLQEKRGMHVMLLAHAQVKTFHDPEAGDYDKYQLALPDRAAEIIKQWPDYLLFLGFETFLKERKGVLGDRVIYTAKTAAFDAKHRHPQGFPDSVRPASWDNLVAAIKAARESNEAPAAAE